MISTSVTIAERISEKQTTGYSQFEIQSGQRTVSSIDIEANTYLEMEWNKVSSTEYLWKERGTKLSSKEVMRKKQKISGGIPGKIQRNIGIRDWHIKEESQLNLERWFQFTIVLLRLNGDYHTGIDGMGHIEFLEID
ncbi:hypothetical protein O181_125679 [Austropuccinia psidii MF-1]|uniref:Uncharacterized protein n=1 Tax=Austropuccinia psidii MF-1 TaxID=1389203 RepID=A0A9Q3Q5G4_9BASI|nr:hypothetical protein [Austropuccinia psidii MF-1]